MKCVLVRTEVFTDVEICSYGARIIDNTDKTLSVFKAEIIEEILSQRKYNCECPETDSKYGHRKEDRYYVYDLLKSNESAEDAKKFFFKKVFNDLHKLEDYEGKILPEGWEEIIPENYRVKKVAFRVE